MTRTMRWAAALLILAGCQAQPRAEVAQNAAAAQAVLVPVTIETARGTRSFRVEVARTPDEQARGLMFRTGLPAFGGMIFPMDPPRPAAFWMRNTLIPLDMIFIRADGTIARIAENTTPESLELVESGEPVAAVLEIGGGRARAEGIAPGDRVRWQG